MVATDDDRRGDLAVPHHLVEREAKPMALAETDPANARRQALKRDPFACHVEPAMQVLIVWNQLLHLLIGAVDVLWVAAQCGPTEGPDSAAEERPDVGGHEARE